VEKKFHFVVSVEFSTFGLAASHSSLRKTAEAKDPTLKQSLADYENQTMTSTESGEHKKKSLLPKVPKTTLSSIIIVWGLEPQTDFPHLVAQPN